MRFADVEPDAAFAAAVAASFSRPQRGSIIEDEPHWRGKPAGPVSAHRSEPKLTRDPVVEHLGHALLAADEIGGSLAALYADCISIAIVARLVAVGRQADGAVRKIAKLPRWRLRRAVDYVERHLAQAVTLADIATAAGLTRMHFAAQFKAATGLRPHEYLLRRRVERAQQLLVEDDVPLVDVALSVGFQTQSHFTSVFKRFVGQPPRAWREAQRDSI
jgi:AraC family transcriptional regulator